MNDGLGGKWDRFSWFGFWPVFGLDEPETELTEDSNTTIGDLEALLIRAIGPKLNSAWMNFKNAYEWTQISDDETEKYLNRLS